MSALAALILAAGTLSHVVVPGESAASVAKQYYGNKDLGDLLLRFNGKPGKLIHPGEKLAIPSCATYKAKAGDTWSALAKRHLGRANASPVLAELNGYPPDQPLRVGTRVVVPVVAHHTLARGESLSSIAQRYYGDPKMAALVQEFGRIEYASKLSVGTVIDIPLVAFVRVEAEPQKPAAEKVVVASPPPVAPEMPKFDAELAAARQSFVEGEYDKARDALEGLWENVSRDGTVADRREWGRLMAFVYVALDRDGDACTAYRSSPGSAGPSEFDPDLVSPRIRTALAGCSLDKAAASSQIPSHGDAQR